MFMFDDMRARELKEEYKSRNIVDEKAFYDIWREDISKDKLAQAEAFLTPDQKLELIEYKEYDSNDDLER